MQLSINEQIALSAIEVSDPFSLPNRIAEIIAKNTSLNCVAIYSGNQTLQKLVGLFMESDTLKIALDSKNTTWGKMHDVNTTKTIDVPQSLTPSSLKKKEIKIGGYPFQFVSQSVKDNIMTVIYNCERRNLKTARRELEKIFPSLKLTIFPLLKLRGRFEDSSSLPNTTISNFLKETATLNGYLIFFLKLITQFFEAEHSSIKISAFNEDLTAEIGANTDSKISSREFEFKMNEKISGTLTITSDKSIVETQQTHFFVNLSLNYLGEIISNCYKNIFDTKAKLNNFFLLSKIYEALIEGKIGNLERIINTALFVGKRMNLSNAELNLLYQRVALKDIGRIIIRYFSKIYSKTFEDEFNEIMSSELLDYFFMRHKEELFREIINASLEFIKLTSDKVRELEGETEKLKITPLLKIILKERLKELESEKCFTITQCPETLKAICPASLETKDCFETENTFCHYHSDGNCKNCFVFYLKNKRRVR